MLTHPRQSTGLSRRVLLEYRLVPLLALVWLSLGMVLGQAANFTVSLDRDAITLGDSVTLTFQFNDCDPDNMPTPNLPGVRISGPMRSSSHSWDNGKSSSSVSYAYQLTPAQVGSVNIPPYAFEIGGKRLTSLPLTLQVVKPGAPSPETIQSGSELAFIKLMLPKKEVYIGEIITLQLQLFARDVVQRIRGFQLLSLPADGFSVGNLTEAQGSQTQIGNAVYRVIPLVATLRAIKAGSLTLGPVTVKIAVEIPSRNRRGNPFIDIFGGGDVRELTLAANPETMQCLPLPTENVPPGFSGAVGNYTMAASAGPTNVAVGDPITLRVQITGRGALDALTLPEQPNWQDFKTYPATSKIESNDKLELQGAKTFEQVIVPQSTAIKELPPFLFSFFDPEQKRYRTLSQAAMPLVVRTRWSGGGSHGGWRARANLRKPRLRPRTSCISSRGWGLWPKSRFPWSSRGGSWPCRPFRC